MVGKQLHRMSMDVVRINSLNFCTFKASNKQGLKLAYL